MSVCVCVWAMMLDSNKIMMMMMMMISYITLVGWLGSRVVSVQNARWQFKAVVQIAVATLSGNSFRQTVHTNCASVHQAAKLVAALLRVAGVTAGLVRLAESNGSLPPGL